MARGGGQSWTSAESEATAEAEQPAEMAEETGPKEHG